MPVVTLSADYVRNLELPASGKIDHYDTTIKGFILETRASGGKTWALRFRDTHGVQKQHKIGDAASITFEKARLAAQQLRSQVVLTGTVAEDRKTKRLIPTLAEFTETHYRKFILGYKKSFETDESFLRNHLLPKFGALHLDELQQKTVIEFHHSLKASGYAAATANRAVILLSFMYTVAKKFKVPGSETNPAAGVPLFETVSRERYLIPEETHRLRLAIEDSDNPQLKYIVALLILCGCRKSELLDSRWDAIDLERKSWRIPVTKNGKPRHVPLSSSALSVLAQVPRWEGCPYVLSNPKTKLPYVSIFCSWNTARKQAGLPEVRIHDLRHSFASNCINQQVSIYEVSKLLGHAQVSTTARYSHLSRETLLAAVEASANATGTDWSTAQTAKAGDNLAVVAG